MGKSTKKSEQVPSVKPSTSEFYAITLVEQSKYAPSRELSRTDLYTSVEKAKEALLDLGTRTAFVFLYDVQFCDDQPFSFEDDYDDIDEYVKAYYDGVEDVVKAVDSLLAWVRNDREEWTDDMPLWLELCEQRYVVHF